MSTCQEDSSYSPYYRGLPIIRGMDKVRRLLKETLEKKGIDMSEASAYAGRNHAYVQQFINRRSPKRLPEDVRQRLAELTGLTEEQLGRTGQHIDSSEYGAQEGDPSFEGITTVDAYRPRFPGAFPGVDARAGAGPGQLGEGAIVQVGSGSYIGHRVINEWMFPPDYLRELKASAPKILMLEVVGDSMSPTLQPGDRIVVDLSHNRPVPDGLYVIDEGDGPLVKRLQLVRRSSPASVEVISDNQNHRPYTLSLEDVSIVGRVAARITRT